ncbi:SMC-Scp complex subunit ScpB [Endozoicomonadaceae bacterium StTr2]
MTTETDFDQDALPQSSEMPEHNHVEDDYVDDDQAQSELLESESSESSDLSETNDLFADNDVLVGDDPEHRDSEYGIDSEHADDVDVTADFDDVTELECEQLSSVESSRNASDLKEGLRPTGERPPLKQIVEAILLAAAKPMTLEQLLAMFDEYEQPDASELQDALIELSHDCEGRGFELKRVASGYRFQVRQNLAPWVSRLWDEKPPRYTRALLETLALVAYRQPITRGEIEDIRGVSVSSNIIRTLLEREWIRVVGHREAPGRPAMFATTRQFLDYFNLGNLDELPTLSEIRDLEQQEERLKEQQAAEAALQASIPLDVPDGEEGQVAATGEGAEEGDELPSDEDSAAQLFAELDELEASLPDNFDDLIKRAAEETARQKAEGEAEEATSETEASTEPLDEDISPEEVAELLAVDEADTDADDIHDTHVTAAESDFEAEGLDEDELSAEHLEVESLEVESLEPESDQQDAEILSENADLTDNEQQPVPDAEASTAADIESDDI